MDFKICVFCKCQKLIIDFYKDKSSKDGYQSGCKNCKMEYQKQYYKDDVKKEKMRSWHINYYNENKDRLKECHLKWISENRCKINASSNLYYSKNSKRISKISGIRIKKRKAIDPVFKLKISVVSRMGSIFKAHGYKKNSKSEKIIGVPFEIAKSYIERQFTNGMCWDNYGKGDDKWHIDHKIPLASANTKEELIKLCHYTNLQPLWSIDNFKKGDKIIEMQLILNI